MLKYKIVMVLPSGEREEQDDVFDTEKEANDYALYLCSCYLQGGEDMYLSNPGDYPLNDDEPEYEIIEITK